MALRLLDLFCGEGGAARGYQQAGFDVVGVDISADVRERYPYEFHQDNWLDFLARNAEYFDVIHASPPCQEYSVTRSTHSVKHPDLLPLVRSTLNIIGKPYVIENVPGAPMINPVTLCGTMFALRTTDIDGTPLHLKRHRLFESNVGLTPENMALPVRRCACLRYKKAGYRVAGMYGGGMTVKEKAGASGYTPHKNVAQRLIGVGTMSLAGMNQCVPPAYTKAIGRALVEHLGHGSRSAS